MNLRHYMSLVETQIHSDDLIQKATKLLMKEIDFQTGSDSEWYRIMIMGDENADTSTEEFKQEFEFWCEGQVDGAYYKINQHIKNNEITIYRVITAPPTWKPEKERHPGIYWSWDANAAEAHWGGFSDGDVKWLLTATVNTNIIDWVRTLVQNAMPDYEDEKEIRVISDSNIKFKYERMK